MKNLNHHSWFLLMSSKLSLSMTLCWSWLDINQTKKLSSGLNVIQRKRINSNSNTCFRVFIQNVFATLLDTWTKISIQIYINSRNAIHDPLKVPAKSINMMMKRVNHFKNMSIYWIIIIIYFFKQSQKKIIVQIFFCWTMTTLSIKLHFTRQEVSYS